MKTKIKIVGFTVIFLVAACVTVNIYFPSAEVQKAADAIVEDVRKKVNDENKKPAPDSSSRLDILKKFAFAPRHAYAATDIDISTPAIRGIKESIKNRFPQLKPFYDRGAIGENNKGYVSAVDITGLELRERSLANSLIAQENRDRASLYKEIAAANRLGPESVSKIEKIFANSWRNKSQSGWWVQNDNGEWKKK